MPNAIKRAGSSDRPALQVTEEVRAAGLVSEDSDGEVRDRAEARVFAFDDCLLAVNPDELTDAEAVELVTSAARDTESIHRAKDTTVTIAGNGYMVYLPPAADAGFREGDTAPCHPAPDMLVVTTDDHDALRLARDLVTIRRSQVESD